MRFSMQIPSAAGTLLLLAAMLAAAGLSAQTRGFSYQAAARNASGALIANSTVNLRFFIRPGSASAPAVYEETHAPVTNAFGLLAVTIGKGTPVAGIFDTIDWASGPHFLSVQLNGADMGTTELEAVPYSAVATQMKLADLTDAAAIAAANGQVLKWNGSQWAPADDSTGGSSQWITAGSSIHYTGGNVGIGDATPVATLTVGEGDKFQVSGAEGDVTFTDDNATIRFPATALPNSPMIQMFSSGTQNADRMVISHSPGFPTWGVEYKDSVDALFFRDGSQRRFTFELGTGQMGIGNTDPAFPLDLTGRVRLRSTGNLSNSPGIWFQNNAGTFDRAFFGMSEPDSMIGIFSQHLGKWAIEFEVMREPRIGINIPAGSPPRAELHMYHTNFGGSNDGVRIQNEGSNAHYWNLYTSNTTGDFEFFKQGIKRATINQTSGAYTALSDARFKTQIASLGSVLPEVMQLQAKTYKYTGHETDKTYSGFLAQDLEKLFPQFVFFGGDDQKTYTVDYAGMSVIALKAIQEQQAQIEQQQQQIQSQQAQIDELKRLVNSLIQSSGKP
jgi:hypothetical protein